MAGCVAVLCDVVLHCMFVVWSGIALRDGVLAHSMEWRDVAYSGVV